MRSFSELQAIRHREGESAYLHALNGDHVADDAEKPALPSAALLQQLADIVGLINGGEAFDRAKEAIAAAEKKAAEADQAVVDSRKDLAAHEAKRAAHAAAIARDRSAFEQERDTALAEIRQERDAAAQLRSKAQADADAAAKLKKDLEGRLALLRQAGL